MRWLVFVVLVCAAAPALADKPGAEKAYNEGLALYKAGDYRGAADKFSLAYERDPDPVYLFNLAQAYRFAKLCQQAADSYTRFLKEAPNAPNKDKVQKYIEEMNACAHSQEPVKPEAKTKVEKIEKVETPTKLEDPGESAPPEEHHEHLAERTEPPPRDDRGPRTGRSAPTLGYALVGVGIVALGSGAFFTYDVSVLNSNTCHNGGCGQTAVDDLNSRGDHAEYAAIASYTIGAAALATGVWLIVHGRDDEHALAIAPTRHGAALGWSF